MWCVTGKMVLTGTEQTHDAVWSAQVHHKKFTYAWCLIHLKAREDIQSGIALLQVWLSKPGQRERRAGIVAVVLKDIFLSIV